MCGGLGAVPSSLGPQHAAGPLPLELSPVSSLPTPGARRKWRRGRGRTQVQGGTPSPARGLEALAVFPGVGGEEECARRAPELWSQKGGTRGVHLPGTGTQHLPGDPWEQGGTPLQGQPQPAVWSVTGEPAEGAGSGLRPRGQPCPLWLPGSLPTAQHPGGRARTCPHPSWRLSLSGEKRDPLGREQLPRAQGLPSDEEAAGSPESQCGQATPRSLQPK